MKTAETVGCGSQTTRTKGAHDAPPHAAKHAPEGPSRVDGEEDIVQNDKDMEWSCLADSPWLLVIGTVVYVEKLGCNGVGSCYGQRHLGIQSTHIDVVGNVEGAHDGHRNRSRRYSHCCCCRREAEELGIGQ